MFPRYIATAIASVFLLNISQSFAATLFEVNMNSSVRDLLVFRKQAENFKEESRSLGFGIGFYRESSANTAWGGVIEVAEPTSYMLEEGSGRIWGFRPINYRRQWHPRLVTEAYFGVAQYEWIKRASGYYAGINARLIVMKDAKWSIGFDYRRYQDLAHDGGPGGDQIIYGFTHSLTLFYRL